jgi:hypothetical protein
MLGLAALAAAALTASVGAGTASATELCKVEGTPCTEKYGSGTTLSSSLVTGSEAVLTTNLDVVKCQASSVGGKTTSEGGSGTTAVKGEITSLSFTTCKDSFGNTCTVTPVNLPYEAEVKGSGEAAELGVKDATGAGATVVCGGVLNCTFTSKSLSLPVMGATTPPTVTAEEVSLERAGGICPSTSTWNAKYTVTAPTPLMVV